MKLAKIVSTTLVLSALLIALPGCGKQGPAEQTGESIDNAVEKTGEAIKDSAQDNYN